MYRAALRRVPGALGVARTRPLPLHIAGRTCHPHARRWAATDDGPGTPSPAILPQRSRPRSRFRNAMLRWALAAAAVYWYCTSPVFADEPTGMSRAVAFPPSSSSSSSSSSSAPPPRHR